MIKVAIIVSSLVLSFIVPITNARVLLLELGGDGTGGGEDYMGAGSANIGAGSANIHGLRLRTLGSTAAEQGKLQA